MPYRELIKHLVLRDLRAKYRGSVAGLLWALLNPLAQIAVLGFAFTYIIHVPIPRFLLFLVSGFLPWNLFQSTLVASTHSIVSSGNLIQKVRFPTVSLPVATVLFNLFEFLFAFMAFMLVYPLIGGFYWIGMILFPAILALQVILLIGAATLLSCITVFLRDMRELVVVGTLLGFWLTPIVYTLELVPEEIQPWFFLNPMVSYVNAYHHLFHAGSFPSIIDWTWMVVWAFAFLIGGLALFKSLERRFPDEV